MNSHRVAVMEVKDKNSVPYAECGLWSRGGLEGVEIRFGQQTISIPREVIMALVGDDLRSREISRLEQMPSDDVVPYLLNSL